MKKILLFVAGLMLAAGASAQVYLRGNGDWNSLDKQFTDNGDGTYTLSQSFTLKAEFKIADETYSTINYGTGGEEAKIGTISVAAGGNNIQVPTAIEVTSMTLDTNASTLTIVGQDGGEITYSSWTICGVAELLGDGWDPTSEANVMTESNGVFTLTKYSVSLSADFVTDADDPVKATPGYGYKVAADKAWGIKEFPADGANQFLSVDADGVYNVIFTWNPSTSELTAELKAATEEPEQPEEPEEPTAIDEVDAEDAVVAAYDLLGRPVAADAAGYVILQYASGKAAKVFNN